MRRPAVRCAPPASSRASADDAVELAASAGLRLDDWQADFLTDALGERVDGSWAASSVALEVPRQNGKGSVLEARALAGLFLFGERLIIWTAHETKTSSEAFLRVQSLIRDTPRLDAEIARINRSHGEEGIELRSGQRLRFIARSRASGRGFSGDVVILDEAFELPEPTIAALIPTMSAKPNSQTWYMSSSVDQVTHSHGHALSRLRVRARSDEPGRLVYHGYSAAERADWEALTEKERERHRRDPEWWARANPAFPHRITAESIEDEIGPLGARGFDIERLGIGDWPSEDAGAWAVVGEAVWAGLVDLQSSATDPVAFSLDTTPDRSYTSIAAAGRRADSLVHVEVIEHRTGTDWAPERLAELVERHKPCATVVDDSGPAGSLIPALERLGVELVKAPAREIAAGCDHFVDLVRNRGLRHRDQPELMAALAGAKKRVIGDEKQWAWARKGIQVVISPLIAATQAAYAFEVYGDKAEQFFGAWR